jgi:hypothetical protein
MTPTVLSRALRLLEARLVELEDRLQGDAGIWLEYLATLDTMVGVLVQLRPEAGGSLLTTKQMAERLGVQPKTVLAMRKRGQLRPAREIGKRGRAAIRWRADEVAQ